MSTIDRNTVLKQALKYHDPLIGYAYGKLRDWSLAKDAVQDALTVIVEKYEQYKPEYGVYLWFREIVRLKTLEMIRRRSREVYVEDEDLLTLVDETLTECVTEKEALAHEDRLSALEVCMSGLPAPVRHVLIGFYYHSESYETIAARMKRTVTSLRMMMVRVRRQLRECMERRLREMRAA